MPDIINETTETKETTPSLTETIDKAVEKHTPDTEEGTKVKAKEEKKEEKKEDYGLTALEEEQARQLFAALKDDSKAPVVLEHFAKMAGYTKKELETATKKEAEEIKDDIQSVLRESLGPELEALADRLAPALDKLIDKKLKDNTKDIRDSLAANEAKKLEDVALFTKKQLAQDYFKNDDIPEDIMSDMSKMMDKIDPRAGTSVGEYIETIFHAVISKRGITKATAGTKEKIEKNRNDAPSRLASEGRGSPTEGVAPAKKMSLDAAIQAAAETVGKGK